MPTEEEAQPFLIVETENLKLAADYSGFNFAQLLEMDCVSFKILFRDAFIYKMKQSKEGRDYLEDCWTLTQTSPDREKLRKHLKSGDK